MQPRIRNLTASSRVAQWRHQNAKFVTIFKTEVWPENIAVIVRVSDSQCNRSAADILCYAGFRKVAISCHYWVLRVLLKLFWCKEEKQDPY
jgi:hypothetical protein